MSVARASAYKKKTLLEHVLLRAETYVGSKEPESMSLYIPQVDTEKKNVHMITKTVTFVPAFFKIFDEIIVNAADNKVRDASTDTIKVTIDPEKGEISVYNNGKGIPVVIHDDEKIYVPEMIFGHLLTGSNYDDDEKRVTGGRNGYGAKLTNIYSTEFSIETFDSIEGKLYKQRWTENMTKCYPPKITSCKKKDDYTKVTFKPDFSKLNMNSIDEDTLAVLRKRVFDLTGSLSNVKVYLNNERIKINSFKDYISTYLVNESEEKPKIVYERINDRWEIAVALSDTGGFQQVSFVNSIATTKGGTHVTYISDQVVTHIKEIIEKKGFETKPAQIKNQLFLFINCLIENPTFEGQVKEIMTLRPNKYGSTCVLSDAFLKKIVKLGIVESTIEMIHEKDAAKLKKTDGQKRNRLTGIKVQDANDAGTKKSKNCTLFIVEGESAMSFAVTGIPVVERGRDTYGAYPIKGKLLNTRDASSKQKLDNKEIAQLKQILGLQEGKIYDSIDSLRYGRICTLVDSDLDGRHIKGLILNWLESSFPSLLKIPGFVIDFISPIVKCTQNKKEVLFYTQKDYEDWKRKNQDGKGWTIKYYKGLGTSKPTDIKKYFSSIDRHLKRFRELTDEDSEKLDLVFSKKRAADRKQWLQRYNGNNQGTIEDKVVSISDFIDKEFIEFSMYDNVRSIPSMVDGLKPGQRKILFTAFKSKLVNDFKVAQFAGKVAESTEYRHGEQSLCETIIGMAQDFVGSNNIALLEPEGAFGTRRLGGKDAASPRYIYTKLKDITRKIFPVADDGVLDYLHEDGISIEPKFYVPIIPMVLINGTEGIGSAYSTTVLSYNLKEIIKLLHDKTMDNEYRFPEHLTPWYKGFKGTVASVTTEGGNIDPTKWLFTGKIQKGKAANTWEITELPLHSWTEKYKEFLEEKILTGELKDYKEYHTENTVHFVIKASPEYAAKMESSTTLEKDFKLQTGKYTSNMMLFSADGHLKYYPNVGEILSEFYNVRIQFYVKRKEHLLRNLQSDIKWAENRLRFIKAVIDGSLIIQNQPKQTIIDRLQKGGYDKKDDKSGSTASSSYDYLLNMPLHSLTMEKITELTKEAEKLKKEHTEIQSTTVEEMYRKDLAALEKCIN